MLFNTMIRVESYHLLHTDILEKSFHVQVLHGCRLRVALRMVNSV